MILYWILVFLGLGAATVWLGGPPTEARLADPTDPIHTIVVGVFGPGLIAAAAFQYLLTGGLVRAFQVMVWACVLTAGTMAFGLRDEARFLIDRTWRTLNPSVAMVRTGGHIELTRSWDGHFRTAATVNGADLRLLVDTGASMVLIPYEDAARLGHHPDRLDFSLPVKTANGQSMVAAIVLDELRVGDIVAQQVPAAVAQPGRVANGLLGMSFLDRLTSVTFRGDRLILEN